MFWSQREKLLRNTMMRFPSRVISDRSTYWLRKSHVWSSSVRSNPIHFSTIEMLVSLRQFKCSILDFLKTQRRISSIFPPVSGTAAGGLSPSDRHRSTTSSEAMVCSGCCPHTWNPCATPDGSHKLFRCWIGRSGTPLVGCNCRWNQPRRWLHLDAAAELSDGSHRPGRQALYLDSAVIGRQSGILEGIIASRMVSANDDKNSSGLITTRH